MQMYIDLSNTVPETKRHYNTIISEFDNAYEMFHKLKKESNIPGRQSEWEKYRLKCQQITELKDNWYNKYGDMWNNLN